MIFYKHFIGDYQRKTNRLSILEDGVYRRLLDEYYANESPLPLENDECFRIVRAINSGERKAVSKILSMYFTKTPDGYIQDRASEEIVDYKDKSDKATRSARVRWDAKASKPPMRTHMQMHTKTDLEPCERDAILDPKARKPDSQIPKQKPERENPPRTPGPSSGAWPVFAHWNTHNALTHHRALTKETAVSINARIAAGYSEADLCKAITRYAELCQAGTAPGHNQWSLLLLMKREEGGWLDRMLDPNYEGIINETRDSRRSKRNAKVLGTDPEIPRIRG